MIPHYSELIRVQGSATQTIGASFREAKLSLRAIEEWPGCSWAQA